MPRRGGCLGAAVLSAIAAPLAGCQGETGTAGCQLTQQAVLPESKLALLPSVRLDQVAGKLVLMGASARTAADEPSIRWVTFDDATGTAGPEHAVPSPTPSLGVWFATSGASAPGDTVLVAWTTAAANGVDAELNVASAPADGSAGLAPGFPVGLIPGGASPTARPKVAMGSSRAGTAGALVWVDSARGVMLALLPGNGELAPLPEVLDDTAQSYSCLALTPGTSDVTVAFYKFLDPVTMAPSVVIAEAQEGGRFTTLTLTLPGQTVGCPVLAPTAGGYAFAWQDNLGSSLGVYDTVSNLLLTYRFASALSFGGFDLQPPLAGFGPVGRDYGVLFAGVSSPQMWRIDASGARRPGALTFPSAESHLGTVSSVPRADSLYATYVDYTTIDGGVGTVGKRYVVRASCF